MPLARVRRSVSGACRARQPRAARRHDPARAPPGRRARGPDRCRAPARHGGDLRSRRRRRRPDPLGARRRRGRLPAHRPRRRGQPAGDDHGGAGRRLRDPRGAARPVPDRRLARADGHNPVPGRAALARRGPARPRDRGPARDQQELGPKARLQRAVAAARTHPHAGGCNGRTCSRVGTPCARPA